MHPSLLADWLVPRFQDLKILWTLPPSVHFAGFVAIVAVLIGAWRVFEKAGKPGWAAVVPIYNFVVLLEITGQPFWWILPIFLCWWVCLGFVFYFFVCLGLARSFGFGLGFAVGLFFLAPVFLLILGFGDYRYVGPAL
jgi:hypothetical protein